MKLKVDEEEVFLDPTNLEVDEVNLNDFLKEFSGTYNYYNTMWAKAQLIQRTFEDRYENTLNDRYVFFKMNDGGSDKLAEAKAKIHDSVVQAKKTMQTAKYVTQQLNGYLRSLDKAHEDALNLGYNLRKEMDKLYPNSIGASADKGMAKLMEEQG